MKVAMKMEIQYYSLEETSLVLENQSCVQEELFGEILLFCCIVLRLLVKFGKSNVGYALAMSLFQLSDKLKEIKDANSFDGPKIVEDRGFPGHKQLLVKLEYSRNNLKFKMKTKGFGFLLKSDFNYYAISTVLVLLSYLVNKRIDNARYMTRLSEVARSCGQAFTSGQISKKNQNKIALLIAGTTVGLQ